MCIRDRYTVWLEAMQVQYQAVLGGAGYNTCLLYTSMIEPGMKPGKTVPEDYGMKSYVLQSLDAVARQGLEEMCIRDSD